MKTDFADYRYAESFIGYFKRNIGSSSSFRIEAEVAEAVVGVMKKQTHTGDDIRAIKEHMRNIEKEEHYDGSGWHGFKNAVRWWLEARVAGPPTMKSEHPKADDEQTDR